MVLSLSALSHSQYTAMQLYCTAPQIVFMYNINYIACGLVCLYVVHVLSVLMINLLFRSGYAVLMKAKKPETH